MRERDPHILCWVEAMTLHGGGGSKVKYGSVFFHWLDDQILMIKDYTYAGIEFRGDSDLAYQQIPNGVALVSRILRH